MPIRVRVGEGDRGGESGEDAAAEEGCPCSTNKCKGSLWSDWGGRRVTNAVRKANSLYVSESVPGKAKESPEQAAVTSCFTFHTAPQRAATAISHVKIATAVCLTL